MACGLSTVKWTSPVRTDSTPGQQTSLVRLVSPIPIPNSDVVASVITIVSSVVTLAVRSQQLIGNYGTLDGKIENLERKARSFAYVVEQVRDAYAPEGSQGLPLDPEVCARLADCEGQLKRFETEVAKLMRQRKKGKHGAGFVLGTWQEKVARPVFELVEDAIATHQNDLQALLVKHHG